MELREAIARRRSVRTYRAEPVAPALLEELLLQATAAPSACNRKGWKFILVNDRSDLDWLYRQGGSGVLRTAGQAILVCYQQQTDNSAWQDNIQSAAACIAYFQLLAHEKGIGSCWICHLPPKREVARYFGVPATHTPIAMISCGYNPDISASGNVMVPPEERIIAVSRWDFDGQAAAHDTIAITVRKVCRLIYYALPFRAVFRKWAARYEKKFEE